MGIDCDKNWDAEIWQVYDSNDQVRTDFVPKFVSLKRCPINGKVWRTNPLQHLPVHRERPALMDRPDNDPPDQPVEDWNAAEASDEEEFINILEEACQAGESTCPEVGAPHIRRGGS